MKTKFVLFFLLLFVAFSVQSIVHEVGSSTHLSEVEILVEYENNEKDIEREALFLVTSSCTLKSIYPLIPSPIFLDNYLAENTKFKPPILIYINII
jgi:hypothetical protein